MKKLNEKTIIQLLIQRLKSSKKTRKIIVCTTISPNDVPLVELLEKDEITFYRGSEKDILVRYLEAANHFDTDFIVSVDGDDIYTDPAYIDKIVSGFEKTNADFIDMAEFPFGIASVGIKKEALQKICEIKKTDNTETGYRLFFTENPIFKVHKLKPESNIKFSDKLRLTIDYEEDIILAKEVFTELGNNFNLLDLLTLFEQKPELLKITENLSSKYKEHWNKNVANTSIKDI